MPNDSNKTLPAAVSQRLKGAFLYLQDQINKGDLAAASTFFENIVLSESQLAREDERRRITETATNE